MKSLLQRLLPALAATLLLGGCPDPREMFCPDRDPLDDAANYRWLIAEQRYFEPLNAWVRNEPLEVFLLKAYREGGMDALKSRHRLECAPRVTMPPCDTCFTCRRTIAKTKAFGEPEHMHCQIGEMSIQADFGPNWTVTAMTYWNRPPVGMPLPTPQLHTTPPSR